MATFNSEHIARLERIIGEAGAQIKAIAEQASATGRMLTTGEHARIEKAREDIQKYNLRLQHEKATAAAFPSQAY